MAVVGCAGTRDTEAFLSMSGDFASSAGVSAATRALCVKADVWTVLCGRAAQQRDSCAAIKYRN